MFFRLPDISLFIFAVFLTALRALNAVPFLQVSVMIISGDVSGETMLGNVFGILGFLSDSRL